MNAPPDGSAADTLGVTDRAAVPLDTESLEPDLLGIVVPPPFGIHRGRC